MTPLIDVLSIFACTHHQYHEPLILAKLAPNPQYLAAQGGRQPWMNYHGAELGTKSVPDPITEIFCALSQSNLSDLSDCMKYHKSWDHLESTDMENVTDIAKQYIYIYISRALTSVIFFIIFLHWNPPRSMCYWSIP